MTAATTALDELDLMIEAVEAFKAMPPEKQQDQIDNPDSGISRARRFMAQLGKAEALAVAQEQERREAVRARNAQRTRLQVLLDDSTHQLQRIDEQQLLDGSTVRQLVALDTSIADACKTLGIVTHCMPADFAAAVSAWARGEASALGATRELQAAATMGGLA